METSLSGVSDAHTRDSIRSMLCVVRNSAFEIYATLRLVQDVIYQMIRSIRKFDSHSRETAELENNNYRMIS